jgi:hypothetical protein
MISVQDFRVRQGGINLARNFFRQPLSRFNPVQHSGDPAIHLNTTSEVGKRGCIDICTEIESPRSHPHEAEGALARSILTALTARIIRSMTPATPFQSGAKPLPPVSVHFVRRREYHLNRYHRLMSTARYLGWSVPMKQHPGLNDQVIDLHADRPGGGPIVSRNCSSLAVDFGNDIWRESGSGSVPTSRHQASLICPALTSVRRRRRDPEPPPDVPPQDVQYLPHVHHAHARGPCAGDRTHLEDRYERYWRFTRAGGTYARPRYPQGGMCNYDCDFDCAAVTCHSEAVSL